MGVYTPEEVKSLRRRISTGSLPSEEVPLVVSRLLDTVDLYIQKATQMAEVVQAVYAETRGRRVLSAGAICSLHERAREALGIPAEISLDEIPE